VKGNRCGATVNTTGAGAPLVVAGGGGGSGGYGAGSTGGTGLGPGGRGREFIRGSGGRPAGKVYQFGDAPFDGDISSTHLNAPVIAASGC